MKPETTESTAVHRAAPRSTPAAQTPQGPPPWALRLAPSLQATRLVPVAGAGPASGLTARLEVRLGDDASLIAAAVVVPKHMGPDALAHAAERVMHTVLDHVEGTPFRHPVRIWNFLPGICAPATDELDRYWVFNAARRRVFAERFGEEAIAAGRVPTASCVGPDTQALSVWVLGAAEPGRPLENPRQVPAFRYSPRYGPKPPCFSRATLACFAGRRALLVAGTASVLGEDTAHEGSLAQQLEETTANLCAVVRQGRRAAGETGEGELLRDTASLRVYAKRAGDIPWLRRNLPEPLRARTVRDAEFLRADICRRELLVEIEIVVDVTPA